MSSPAVTRTTFAGVRSAVPFVSFSPAAGSACGAFYDSMGIFFSGAAASVDVGDSLADIGDPLADVSAALAPLRLSVQGGELGSAQVHAADAVSADLHHRTLDRGVAAAEVQALVCTAARTGRPAR